MTSLCPHCGYNLQADAMMVSGDLRIDPRGLLSWKGETVSLSPSQREILASVVKADGRPVSYEVLAERIGYDGEDPRSLVKSQVFHMRRRVPGLPINTVWGVGLRWAA